VDVVRRVLAEEGVHEAEVVAADIARPQSLRALAERARVALNVVGPYAPVGRAVVATCVAAGAHYVDISGPRRDRVRRTQDRQLPLGVH
jgi:short subunit dehydrogenase-like uncharacterized protein